MGVVVKRVRFGYTALPPEGSTAYLRLDDPIINEQPGKLAIAFSDYEASYISSVWDNIGRQTPIADMQATLNSIGILGTGATCYNPNMANNPPFENNTTYYPLMMSMFPNCNFLTGPWDTNYWVTLAGNDGTRILYGRYNTPDKLLLAADYNVNFPSTNLLPGLAYAVNNDPYLGGNGFFITSDNRVGYYQLRYNRTNSYMGIWDTTMSSRFITWFNHLEDEPIPPTDPYNTGSTSGKGGGRGTFSRTGDTVGIPSLPTLSAVDAGFITLFKPSISELTALASYMWTGAFDLDSFKKIFANPMDCILGMSIVPVAVPSGGSSTVKVGNISTGVSMTKASTQYVALDCGSVKIKEYWGAYLDYAPYTKAQIYLPYIGMRELDIDDVMDKTLHVVYHVDILSGACIAYIQSEGTVVYSFIGQCSSSVPISGNDWTNVVNGVLNIAGAIGSTIATGGLTAPIAGVASIASTVASSKPTVERSGSISGTGGLMGVQTPYLIITWPKECVPDNQGGFIGYPSYVTTLLNDLTGYNKISSIHLENVSATENEKAEIESLLKEGVIF